MYIYIYTYLSLSLYIYIYIQEHEIFIQPFIRFGGGFVGEKSFDAGSFAREGPGRHGRGGGRIHTRECLGHHRKGTPGIGNLDCVCLMSGNSLIIAML